MSSPRLAADLLGNDSVENISFAEDYTSFPAKPRPTLLLTCTCSVRHSIWELSWPPMFIHYNKRTLHQHGCPRYHYSRVQCTLGARLILPKLLGRSFHAMFSATHGAGGYTLASTLIAVRVVDRTISPAFRTIDIAQQEIVDLGYPDVMDRWGWFTQRRPQYTLSQQERLSKAMVILEKVRNELQSSFCSGKASPSDQDTTGFTLLHVGQV